MLNKLIKLADELDKRNYIKEANEIDELLEVIGPLAKEEEKEELFMTICPECEGEGMTADSPWCPTCKGKGFVK
jgi:hypothetical protein